MTRIRDLRVFFGFTLLLLTTASAAVEAGSSSEINGKVLLENYCGRCHAVDSADDSPLKQAPPFREIYRNFPIERLEFELSEGIGSKHQEMPQIQFSTEQIAEILNYLATVADAD